jgi:hypothetical protein
MYPSFELRATILALELPEVHIGRSVETFSGLISSTYEEHGMLFPNTRLSKNELLAKAIARTLIRREKRDFYSSSRWFFHYINHQYDRNPAA